MFNRGHGPFSSTLMITRVDRLIVCDAFGGQSERS
jgi:hypothetical protein